jgi:hypothetical protein
MMGNQSIPTFDEFLQFPLDAVAPLAPKTLVYAAGGTRRSAALAGVPTSGDAYALWAYRQMIDCFDLFFQHGVCTIMTHAIIPNQYNEVTGAYREKLFEWVDQVLAGPDQVKDYCRRGWNVRLFASEPIPQVIRTADRLRESNIPGAPTLCFTVTTSEESLWASMLDVVARERPRTQADAIAAYYGQAIDPVDMYISCCKPGIFPAILPPFLMGNVQCYWVLRPGFVADPRVVRELLYDYAYVRKTWQPDKTGRAEMSLEHRQVWEQAPTLGLGTRLGPFWYPRPIAALPDIFDT